MEMWLRRREAASAGLSAALYSVYSGLYSETVVSSVTSAVALAEVGQFREVVQYVQMAARSSTRDLEKNSSVLRWRLSASLSRLWRLSRGCWLGSMSTKHITS
jgi:hypothetical protein